MMLCGSANRSEPLARVMLCGSASLSELLAPTSFGAHHALVLLE
jgi:hypothetical protein